LAVLGELDIFKNAYLAGGTALALQLGHRISVDFDFFTAHDFDPRFVASELTRSGRFIEEQAGRGTVSGEFEGIRFSFFIYKYPLLTEFSNYCSVNIADIRDISAMKIDAIVGRGVKRDFVDVYFICQSGYTLKDLLTFYDEKYKLLSANRVHIQKSLVFFEDAEPDPMPRMIKQVSWEQIKTYFETEIKKIS
jgi:hypothetical protein